MIFFPPNNCGITYWKSQNFIVQYHILAKRFHRNSYSKTVISHSPFVIKVDVDGQWSSFYVFWKIINRIRASETSKCWDKVRNSSKCWKWRLGHSLGFALVNKIKLVIIRTWTVLPKKKLSKIRLISIFLYCFMNQAGFFPSPFQMRLN